MYKYIGALDLGTTSNRFIIFDHRGQIKGLDQMEHEQIYPQPVKLAPNVTAWRVEDIRELMDRINNEGVAA